MGEAMFMLIKKKTCFKSYIVWKKNTSPKITEIYLCLFLNEYLNN